MLPVFVALLALEAPAAPAVAVPRQQQRAAVADAAGIGIRLLDLPTSRVDDPRAHVYIVDHVRPGTLISRRVEVRNTSSEPQQIEMYASAASIERNEFTVPDGRAGNELSGWIRLGTPSLTLDPDERRVVSVDIDIPRTASKGERYGAIWAQVTSQPQRGGTVTQIHRVGIRVYLDIGPGGEPPTDFRIDTMTAEHGGGQFPVLVAQVVNTGQRALDMTGTLTLGKQSVKAGPFKVTNGVTIAPGDRGRVTVEIDQELPAGVWTARLVLASGTVQRTAEGKITLPVPDSVAAPTRSPGWLAYSLGTGTAVLVLAILVGGYLIRRRSRLGAGGRLA